MCVCVLLIAAWQANHQVWQNLKSGHEYASMALMFTKLERTTEQILKK
jgi:hypothetical protein